MLSHDDLPGCTSQTHDLNDLQRRVNRELSSCGTSSLFTRFIRNNLPALPLRYLRHGFVALSIPAALLAGTVLPAAKPAQKIAPVAAAYAVQSSLSAFQGDGVIAAEAVDDEFVFTESTTALGSPVNAQYAPVSVGVAILRKGPGTDYERVGKLSQGQTVRLLARSDDWYNVQTKAGKTGWLHSELIDVASQVSDNLKTVTVQSNKSKSSIATTTDSNVNLRVGPSTNHNVLAKLPQGAKLEVIGRQDGWVKVATAKGTVGWVTDDYVTAGAIAAQSASTPAPATTSSAVAARVNDSQVNLRKGPNTKFGSFGRMAKGAAVQVLARHGDWLKVRSVRGTVGWVASDLINLGVDLSTIPVTNDVPALPKRVEATPAKQSVPTAAVSAPTVAASGDAASIALQFVGTRYAYGGSSPRGFDCSGLTSYVYRQLGVKLPHKASLQFSTRYGQKVSRNNLAPGDLVFFANTAGRGITHVALYVGNGMMVTANTPRTGVQYLSIYSRYWQSHYAGAIRPFR